MPQVCTICTHPQTRAIDLAIIRQEPMRRIALQYKTTDRAVKHHTVNHLSTRLEAALKRDTARREIDLKSELAACFRRVNLLLNACHTWLTDPENEEAYSLDSRAEEVTVIYVETDENGKKSKHRGKLQTLLDRINEKLEGEGKRAFEWVETKRADPRKLILDASVTLDKHLRMLGDLTGEFKAPQHNPREVNRTLYDEWVGMFLSVLRNLDPKIERPAVVQLLADMPATLGEFAPFVQEELGGYVN